MKASLFKSITVIGVVILAATAALGQSPTLDMTVWPTTVGWPQVSVGGGGAGGISTVSMR